MKKTIIIFALSRTPWIGGIYYRKNIVHMLLSNTIICDKYQIGVITNEKYKSVFQCFEDKIILRTCNDRVGVLEAAWRTFLFCIKTRAKYIFPMLPYRIFSLLKIMPVSWIADFQHCYYPEFFSEGEIKKRNRSFWRMTHAKNPLVLSSEVSLSDMQRFFNKTRTNVHIVHFSSYIDEEIEQIRAMNKEDLLEKFNLNGMRYCIICNQFWKHKNHEVVLKAIKVFSQTKPSIRFVFTGELNDRRNPEYIRIIKNLFEKPGIKEYVILLGFISRLDQLFLMKEAELIIQPSLFEGWGTTVEDGKRLGKKMILSDIDVHKEQMNESCYLFKKDDPVDLARTIELALGARTDNNGNDDTKEYSKALNEVFV